MRAWVGRVVQSMAESPESTRTSRSDLADLDDDLQDDDAKRQHEQQQQRSTVPMAAFNFINSIIGSGIVGQYLMYTHTHTHTHTHTRLTANCPGLPR